VTGPLQPALTISATATRRMDDVARVMAIKSPDVLPPCIVLTA
jgi:hypothetical protein